MGRPAQLQMINSDFRTLRQTFGRSYAAIEQLSNRPGGVSTQELRQALVEIHNTISDTIQVVGALIRNQEEINRDQTDAMIGELARRR